MSLIAPIANAFATFERSRRYAHLFALSDHDLARRGLDREALKALYLAETDAAIEARDRSKTSGPALRPAFS